MKTKLTKEQANKKINYFFKILKNKKPEQIKKIKRLAMHYNIKLCDKTGENNPHLSCFIAFPTDLVIISTIRLGNCYKFLG